jgi:hypothetical protein
MSYIGSTPTTQSFIAGTDYFNGTGSAVNFTMSRSVNSVNDIEVLVNNVEQIPSGYLVSGTTLTFSVAPSAGTSNVYVRYLSTTNLSLAIPAGTSATFNTVTATSLTATTLAATNVSYTGTLTGNGGIVNIGSGQVYKDASGNVGIGTSSPTFKIQAQGNTPAYFGADATAGTQIGYAAALPSNSASCFVGWIPDTVGTGGVNGDLAIQPRTSAGANIRFFTGSTSATERARIDSSGNLLVGATSTINARKTLVAYSDVTNNGFGINETTGASGTQFQAFFSNGTSCGAITRVGATSAVTYGTSSDYRLKKNILPMVGALEKVLALKPCTYTWKNCDIDSQGFIAHELAEVCPDAVQGEKDALEEEEYEVTPAVKDEEGGTVTGAVMGTRTAPKYQSIDTSFLVATLTAAIQEQQTLITALTARITALEAK